MEKFVIIHDCKYGKDLESHIFVAERDDDYVGFMVRYRQWDNKITENTLLYDSEEDARTIVENYLLSCTHDAPSKEEQLKDFWFEKVNIIE